MSVISAFDMVPYEATAAHASQSCNASFQRESKIHGLREIFFIGDIHGDYLALFTVLAKTGCVRQDPILKTLQWVPKHKVGIVFTGDLVDRWRPGWSKQDPRYADITASIGEDAYDEMRIEKTINDLAMAAEQSGGLILRLVGNHEFVNRFHGSCTNVSDLALHLFGKSTEEQRAKACAIRHARFKPAYDLGAALEQCGGVKCFFVADNVLACHGGVHPDVARSLHQAGGHLSYANDLLQKGWDDQTISEADKFWAEELLNGPKGLLWDRSLSVGRPSDEYVKEVFDAVHLHYPQVHTLVVGHSIQEHGVTVIETPHGRVVRIDVGMSRSFLGENATQSGESYVQEHAHLAHYDVANNKFTVV